MSVYLDAANQSQRWKFREAITIDCTGGGGTIDATCVVPKDWDLFWLNVKAAGADIRVTDADGGTLLTYDLNGFNATTRVLTLEIDNYAAPSAAMVVVWLYWGNASAVDASTVFAPASAKTGYIEPGGPIAPIVIAVPDRPGELRPRQQISKDAGETINVTFDFAPVLQRRVSSHGDSRLLEEIDYAAVVVEAANANQAGMVTLANLRVVHPAYVIGEIKAGTHNSDYTVIAKVTTITVQGRARSLVRNIWLKVRTTDEI